MIIQLIENKEAYILAVAYVLPQNDFSEGTQNIEECGIVERKRTEDY
jgi:hypothetical protein